MNTETEKVQEVQVLTADQIKALPKEAVESVTFLTKQVGAKDLAVLNPLVTELLELRVLGSKLKIIEADKEGKFDKKNIQEFIDCQGKIKNYRSRVKSSAIDLKKPYQDINKGYIVIEKAFVGEATKVFDAAEKEFKPYRDQQKKDKADKLAAKNKALTDAVDKSKAIADEATLKMDRSNLYNSIKYDGINVRIVEKSTDAVLNANKRNLEELRTDITGLDFETILNGRDEKILEPEVCNELRGHFVDARTKAIKLINDRLVAIKIEEDNLKLQSVIVPGNAIAGLVDGQKKIDEIIPPAVPNVPGAIPNVEIFKDLIDAEFINYIVKEARNLLTLTQNRIEKVPHSSPIIYDLRNILSQINKLKV